MRNILFISLLFLSLTACKKKELEFSMSGIISDATFGQALNGATVKLTQKPSGGGTLKVVGSTVVGADGRFHFTFKREQAEKFFIEFSKDNYFDVNEPISFDDFSTEKELVRNYSTTAKSWVKLRFKNIPPSEQWDYVKWTKQLGKSNCGECSSNEEYAIYGIVDTTFKFITDGNAPFSFRYNASNPIVGPTIKTMTSVAFDTVDILVEY